MIRKQRIAHSRPRFKVTAHLPLRSPQLCSCTAMAWNAGPSAQQTRDHGRVRELHLWNQAVGQIVLPLTTNGVASAGYFIALSPVYRVRKTKVPASQKAWESNEVMDVAWSVNGTLWALMCVTWLCYTTTTSAAAPRLLREAEAEGQEEGGASRLVTTRSPLRGEARERKVTMGKAEDSGAWRPYRMRLQNSEGWHEGALSDRAHRQGPGLRFPATHWLIIRPLAGPRLWPSLCLAAVKWKDWPNSANAPSRARLGGTDACVRAGNSMENPVRGRTTVRWGEAGNEAKHNGWWANMGSREIQKKKF